MKIYCWESPADRGMEAAAAVSRTSTRSRCEPSGAVALQSVCITTHQKAIIRCHCAGTWQAADLKCFQFVVETTGENVVTRDDLW